MLCIDSAQKNDIIQEKQHIVNFYKKQVQTYDNVSYFAYWDQLYKKYDKLIEEYFSTPGTIIDVGCGTGLISEKLTYKRHSVFGIDISQDFLTKAKTKCGSGQNLFVRSIAEKIPLQDNIADGTICIETMDHIDDIELTVKDISRICKKRGIFIFDMTPQITLNVCSIIRNYFKIRPEKTKSQKHHTHNWSIVDDTGVKSSIAIYKHHLDYVEKLLAKYGFNIIQKYGMHISSVILFSEDFQVSSKSHMLFLLHKVFSKIDEKILNKINFFQNKATCLIYVCQKS